MKKPPMIVEFINEMIKSTSDLITLNEMTERLPFNKKQTANLVLRAIEKGYLKSELMNLPGEPQLYRILKRDPYVSRVRFRPGTKPKAKAKAKAKTKITVPVENIRSVKVQSVNANLNNSHIDIVVTIKIEDIFNSMMKRLKNGKV